MKTLIVDDERLARQELRAMLAECDDIDIVGEARDGLEALDQIKTLQPELVFLDIQMPGLSGFEVLERLPAQPIIIFVTAYDQYAIRAFEFSALDYLLKPVEKVRLQRALQRARGEIADDDIPALVDEQQLTLDDRVLLREGERCWFVGLDNISVLESIGNYTRVHFDGNKPMLRRSLNQLESRLPREHFFRANRQCIFNFHHIAKVDTAVNGNLDIVLKDGFVLELSRRQSQEFRERMSL